MNFLESLPPNTKLVWTCNDHKECKTCQYFYESCHGLSNSSDPRIKHIPEDLNDYIRMNWMKTDNKYIYRKRQKEFQLEYLKIAHPKLIQLDLESFHVGAKVKFNHKVIYQNSRGKYLDLYEAINPKIITHIQIQHYPKLNAQVIKCLVGEYWFDLDELEVVIDE